MANTKSKKERDAYDLEEDKKVDEACTKFRRNVESLMKTPENIQRLNKRVKDRVNEKRKEQSKSDKRKDRITDETVELNAYDMGVIADVSHQTVRNWVDNYTRETKEVKLSSIIRIARAYNVSVDWLLGLSGAPSKDVELDYKPFEEMGISYAAYETLKDLKEQGTDMNELLKGINLLLTYTVVGRKPITNDEFDLGTEREYIDITILPIINALNSYLFSLYKEGGYTRLTTKKFHDIVDWASNYNPSESAYDEEQEELIFQNLFEKGIKEESPEFSEITLLNVLDHELKKCKGLIIKEELQKVQAKVEKLDLNKMEKEDAWLPAISVILTHLDKFYNSN